MSVATSMEAEEAVGELLGGLTGQGVCSYHDFRRRTLTVSTTFASWPEPRRSLLGRLKAGLASFPESGLDPAPASITIRRLPPVDWAESWKAHFPDLDIEGALLVRPGWSRRQPRRGQCLIELDPGLSFGTGHHPTTRFCLEELVRLRPGQLPRSMLDVGTGSGLLAIAAAKLGYAPVQALDFDPASVRIARANARRNQVDTSIGFRCADLRDAPRFMRSHDVVCANLQGDLLLECARRLLEAVRPGGHLVLAGITRLERGPILQAYANLGLRRERGRTRGEWSSLTLRTPS